MKKKNQLWSIGLLTVLLCITGTKAYAYDIMATNDDGISIYYDWTNNHTELAVSRGEYFITEENTGTVAIPEYVTYQDATYPVTSIGRAAFYSCRGLKGVTIPNSVVTIGEDAFCFTGLESVIIPNSVTTIGNRAFYICSDLSSVTMSESVATIGGWAFAQCPSIKSITIPNSIEEIGQCAFQGCDGLKSVTFHCKEIGGWFAGLSNIREVVIGEEVTAIGGTAFYNFYQMTNVDIPNSVTSIGSHAFSGCKGLKNIVIPSGVTNIGEQAFQGCSQLTSVVIPDGVTSIGKETFEGCEKLTNAIISNNVVNIGERAFANCSSLTSVVIPPSVTSIDNGAFYFCISMTSLTIPNSVTSIGENSFIGCNAINDLRVPVTDYSAFCNNGYVSLIWQRIGKWIKLIDDEGQEIKDITIPEDVTHICSYAFSGCSGLTSLSIPNSVSTIGDNAFWGCSGLTSLSIPNSVSSIGDNAFYQCHGLTSLLIPNSVEAIGYMAFYGCPLENVVIRNCNTTRNSSFSYNTYEHATLYVPAGKLMDAFDSDWYVFYNIREIALNPSELSPSSAYLMMNMHDFNFAVYDGVGDKVVSVESLYDVEEDNPDCSWQIVKEDGKYYLYNIGAYQYASINDSGELVLSSTPTAINIKESENGILLGDNLEKFWGFVLNEKVQAGSIVVGIEGPYITDATQSKIISLGGCYINEPLKGVNIIRMNNGKTMKVVVK